MYPIECQGGFFVPIKAGKFEIVGFHGVVKTTSSASRVTLIDDKNIASTDKFGRILSNTHDAQTGLIDIKGIADQDGYLEQIFPAPIKLRRGISVVDTTNVVAGTLKLYVK